MSLRTARRLDIQVQEWTGLAPPVPSEAVLCPHGVSLCACLCPDLTGTQVTSHHGHPGDARDLT